MEIVSSRAAQAGLAGSPSLFANIVNSPVPADRNTLNAPAVDDVVRGNAGVALVSHQTTT